MQVGITLKHFFIYLSNRIFDCDALSAGGNDLHWAQCYPLFVTLFRPTGFLCVLVVFCPADSITATPAFNAPLVM